MQPGGAIDLRRGFEPSAGTVLDHEPAQPAGYARSGAASGARGAPAAGRCGAHPQGPARHGRASKLGGRPEERPRLDGEAVHNNEPARSADDPSGDQITNKEIHAA